MRIAWDSHATQIALIEAGLASNDEVMTPWMLGAGGHTMYEAIRESSLRAFTNSEN